MAIVNAERKPKEEFPSEAEQQDRQAQNQACIALLEQWLADDSGYDEATWPQVQQLLEENRSSSRPLFNE